MIITLHIELPVFTQYSDMIIISNSDFGNRFKDHGFEKPVEQWNE